jgi:hypothetical protein
MNPQDDIDTLQLLGVKYAPAASGFLQLPVPPSSAVRADIVTALHASDRLTHFLMDRVAMLEGDLRGAKLTLAALTKMAGGDLSVPHALVEALQTTDPARRGEFSVLDEETPEGFIKRLRWRDPEGQDAVQGASAP